MIATVGVIAAILWVFIALAQVGHPGPLITLISAIAAQILWTCAIRPLGTLLFVGYVGETTLPGTTVQDDGRPPAEWGLEPVPEGLIEEEQ